MADSFVEREIKFDVAADFLVPDVTGLLPEGGRTESSTEQLRSDYYDTGDRALLGAQMTLRRRTGTTDAGWQLKVPRGRFREEIRVDLSDDAVPAELGDLLLGVRRGQPLTLIASVLTKRSVARLLDADGRHLAEIDDDTVHASATGKSATATSWREVEVELGEGEVELLYALGKCLRRAGATPSGSTSKLARALPDTAASTKTRSKPRAADVIARYLAEQQNVILAGDLALRRGDDTVIHQTRVATRRLRSTLRVYAQLFDHSFAAALDSELQWLAQLLGEVRDRQVLRARLDKMIDQIDDTLLLGPVRARVDTELTSEQGAHWQTLLRELNGERYLALLAAVNRCVVHPPWTPSAEQSPKTVAKFARRAERQVSRRLAKANATGDVHLLHAARKAAKRARYAAEAAAPVVGVKAAAIQARRYQKLQDLLGEHQDSLVSAEVLRRLGAKAGTAKGENGFSFGILHEREAQAARAARAMSRRAAKNLPK